MSETLKKKTASGLIWNAIDKGGFQLVALAVGIITARILSPKDFGLIGALTIFTLLSSILIDSGFTSALMRRERNTSAEYSAILYFNLGLSVVIYFMLFFSAPFIAAFFRMPELCSLSRFLFLTIIINSFGVVQNIILSKELLFRLTSLANLTSAIVSGVITIIMVKLGYEYWALAWQVVLQSAIKVSIIWICSSWRFSPKADFRIIREVFSFSFFLLLTSLINTVVKNIYNLIIGRSFSVQELGYYSQANKFQQIPTNVITMTLSGVGFPVLSKLNTEADRQLLYLRKIIRISAFLIFPIMVGMFSITKGLVSIVLTDKWLPSVPYFQLMAIAAIVYPLHTLNLNMIVVKGHSRLNFALEMAKNSFILLSLFIFRHSILNMLVGFLVANLLSYICDLIFTQKIAGYKIVDQLKDIFPYAAASFAMYLIVKAIGFFSSFSLLATTTLQVTASIVFYLGILKILGSQVLNDALEMLGYGSAKKVKD